MTLTPEQELLKLKREMRGHWCEWYLDPVGIYIARWSIHSQFESALPHMLEGYGITVERAVAMLHIRTNLFTNENVSVSTSHIEEV